MHQGKSTAKMAAFLVGTLVLVGSSGAAAQQQKQAPPPKTDPKAPATLTGCIDEQEGLYVLLKPDDRTVLANLEAEGFPTEGFAKHLGHKVTIRGTSIPRGTTPLFRVRSIETISETCAPG
jgi:hypothetical protein